MDTTLTTNSLPRAIQAPRDRNIHRKAFLDTHARHRAGLPAVDPATSLVAPENVVTPVQANLPTIAEVPQQVVAQTVSPTPAPAPVPVIPTYQEQTFAYSQAPTATTPIAETQLSQKVYLDTITRRKAPTMQEVTASPEPVQEIAHQQFPALNMVNEAKIEANLRALYLDEQSLTNALMKDSQSASAAHMRTIVASAFACGIIAVSMFTFFGRIGSQPVIAQPVGAPVIEVEAPRPQPTSTAPAATAAVNRVKVNPDQPVRFVISSIGVNAPVEGVGQTPEGLMSVPKSYGIVGWYNKGSLPGQKGPAVLAGHYTGGYGGVFDKLADLKDGDLITTTNGRGESFTYKVTKKAEYEKDKVPMAELFKTGDESRLEIITCAGKWQAQNYEKRLVVTAELVR